MSVEWQIEEDVYYPKMLQIEALVKKEIRRNVPVPFYSSSLFQ